MTERNTLRLFSFLFEFHSPSSFLAESTSFIELKQYNKKTTKTITTTNFCQKKNKQTVKFRSSGLKMTALSALMVGEGLASLVVRLGVWHQRTVVKSPLSLRVWSCGSPNYNVNPLAVTLPEHLVQRLEALGGPNGLGLQSSGQRIDYDSRIHQLGSQYGSVATPGALAVSTKTLQRLVGNRILMGSGATKTASTVKVDKFQLETKEKLITAVFKGEFVKPKKFDLVIAGDGHSSRVREKLFPSSLGATVDSAAYWEAIVPRPVSIDPHSRVDVWANGLRLRWTPLEDSTLLVSALEPNARGGGLSLQSGSQSTRRFLSAIAPNITCPRADPIFAALHDHNDAPCQVTYTKLHDQPLFYEELPAVLLGPSAASVWPSFDVEAQLEIEDALELVDALISVGEKEQLHERLLSFEGARSTKYQTVRKNTEKIFKKLTKAHYFHRLEDLKRRVLWGDTYLSNEHRQVYQS